MWETRPLTWESEAFLLAFGLFTWDWSGGRSASVFLSSSRVETAGGGLSGTEALDEVDIGLVADTVVASSTLAVVTFGFGGSLGDGLDSFRSAGALVLLANGFVGGGNFAELGSLISPSSTSALELALVANCGGLFALYIFSGGRTVGSEGLTLSGRLAQTRVLSRSRTCSRHSTPVGGSMVLPKQPSR